MLIERCLKHQSCLKKTIISGTSKLDATQESHRSYVSLENNVPSTLSSNLSVRVCYYYYNTNSLRYHLPFICILIHVGNYFTKTDTTLIVM